MSPDSLTLTDDKALPDTKVYSHATQVDMTMMTAMVSKERTSEQWFKLLEATELKVKGVHVYTGSLKDSIIAVGLV